MMSMMEVWQADLGNSFHSLSLTPPDKHGASEGQGIRNTLKHWPPDTCIKNLHQ